MESKKWSVILLSSVLIVTVLFGTATYILDPLLQYGKEPGNLSFRYYSELYCNPGIAKNYDYNAVLVGSSMVELTDVEEINEMLDCTVVKVPYSGASSYNHKHILDVCFRSGNRIDKVFWALDEYALTTEKNTPRYPLPEYLYDYDITNDLFYLLNLDIFYFYTVKDLIGIMQNKKQILMNDASWKYDESIYSKDNALSSVDIKKDFEESKGELYYSDYLNDNLESNIIPLIEEHPDTEFIFYMVPYSILYWYSKKAGGTLEAEIYVARKAIGELLTHENVKVFFFQDNAEIITNLDNYKDFSHFDRDINSYMTEEMAKGNNLLSLETYNERLDEFYAYLSEYDYSSLFE